MKQQSRRWTARYRSRVWREATTPTSTPITKAKPTSAPSTSEATTASRTLRTARAAGGTRGTASSMSTPRVHGRSLSSSATASSSAPVTVEKSKPLGKYCLSRPLVFSLEALSSRSCPEPQSRRVKGWISVSAENASNADPARARSPMVAGSSGLVRVRVWERAFSDVSDERGTLLLVTEKQQSRRRPHRCRRPANRKRGEAENLCGVSPLDVEPFEIEVPERTLSDLRERIRNTRWPPPSPEPGWEQGAELCYVRGLLKYWADGFDWRLQGDCPTNCV